MGDSHKAGNAGQPATPRDGADIELQALLASCIAWLDSLYDEGTITVPGVTAPAPLDRIVAWGEWLGLLKRSFALHMYVPLLSEQAVWEAAGANLALAHVQRRGIFKDTYGGADPRADYQFRPNQFVAMAIYPELFNPVHAAIALQQGLEHLAGPLGVRTLDPADPAYRGDYDNGNDGTDKTVAHGWNYHQGPEWLWLAGHLYRALLHFGTLRPDASEWSAMGLVPSPEALELSALPGDTQADRLKHTLQVINSRLLPARVHINSSSWAGLPELTNRNGSKCNGSCPTQAWSAATLLELEHDMFKMRESVLNRSLTMEMRAACRINDE
ncbi:bifunctional 4-alpha-glucanotransferase/amylo-alpha-1,6-glucosidase [Blastocladiella emersonii ATCC 22665]|nr:bifunctional 4-alpha-glucanotransferase/amylo-alpha-1,6-glucosidase [Blastocladiella emersonii ATCC 22665]